jgi:hypothetical protein
MEENKRRVQIRDKFRCDFIEYVPSDELDETKQLDLTDEERYSLGITKCFDLENNCVIDYDNTEELKKQEISKRIAELKELLSNTDYKAIKFAEGEMTHAEYEPIREQRKAWRSEINKLENE